MEIHFISVASYKDMNLCQGSVDIFIRGCGFGSVGVSSMGDMFFVWLNNSLLCTWRE